MDRDGSVTREKSKPEVSDRYGGRGLRERRRRDEEGQAEVGDLRDGAVQETLTRRTSIAGRFRGWRLVSRRKSARLVYFVRGNVLMSAHTGSVDDKITTAWQPSGPPLGDAHAPGASRSGRAKYAYGTCSSCATQPLNCRLQNTSLQLLI
jgi:hypothetical protein